ncbi:MAG TPA: hypothetical protein VFW07_08065 [Parafilimonas sp.]|nr:hypothetical protein [Parafilimonas sp.]
MSVYVFPIGLTLAMCALIYAASSAGYLSETDSYYGYILSLTPGMFLFAYNKRNWLKMPGNTYYNIKGIPPQTKVTLNEPAVYEEEFYYSKKEKTIAACSGIAIMGVGIFISRNNQKTILIPIITILGGLFIAYKGIVGLLDRTPKLKLAKEGLWTNKLGFVDWSDIVRAKVIEDKTGRSTQTILEIYLKGTIHAAANQPDERLMLTEIENKQYVEMIVDNLMGSRNQ